MQASVHAVAYRLLCKLCSISLSEYMDEHCCFIWYLLLFMLSGKTKSHHFELHVKILGNPTQAPPTYYPFQIPPMLKPDRRLCQRAWHHHFIKFKTRLYTATTHLPHKMATAATLEILQHNNIANSNNSMEVIDYWLWVDRHVSVGDMRS